jgi:hypothetical protein
LGGVVEVGLSSVVEEGSTIKVMVGVSVGGAADDGVCVGEVSWSGEAHKPG